MTPPPTSKDGQKRGPAPSADTGQGDIPSGAHPAAHPTVAQALGVLRERFQEPLTAGVILSGVPMSRRRLHEAFLRTIGRSAAEELAFLRVAHAKRLLVETGEKQGWIALHAGFASDARFVQVFRRLEGVSPGEFRRRANPSFADGPRRGRPPRGGEGGSEGNVPNRKKDF